MTNKPKDKNSDSDPEETPDEVEARDASELGDVNEGHDSGALQEASERMLMRDDRT